jgi:hypothetical protein
MTRGVLEPAQFNAVTRFEARRLWRWIGRRLRVVRDSAEMSGRGGGDGLFHEIAS